MSDAVKIPTKICPRCAEEIKQAALACHYCGYEFSASPLATSVPYTTQPSGPYSPPPSPPPAYVPPTAYAQPQTPGYAPPVSGQPPMYGQAPLYVQAAPVDPRLSGATAEYGKRHYKIVAGAGSSVTMERPATKFNWLWMIGLFILFGVGSLIYLLAWTVWGVHRSYRAVLSVGPQGEVEEAGETLAVFDRDRLKAHRVRSIGFGILLAIVGVLMTIGMVGATVAPTEGAEPMPVYGAVIGWLIAGALPMGVAAFLFNSARKAKLALGSSVGQPPEVAAPAATTSGS